MVYYSALDSWWLALLSCTNLLTTYVLEWTTSQIRNVFIGVLIVTNYRLIWLITWEELPSFKENWNEKISIRCIPDVTNENHHTDFTLKNYRFFYTKKTHHNQNYHRFIPQHQNEVDAIIVDSWICQKYIEQKTY